MSDPAQDPTDDLTTALKELRDTAPEYVKAEQYADGPVEEVFVSQKIRWVMRNSGVTFQELLGDVVIDAVANRLKIMAVLSDDERVADAITMLDKTAKLKLLRPEVNRKTLTFGDYYLWAWLRPDGSLQVVPVDPRNARLFYEPDDPTVPRLAVRRWQTPDKHVRVDLAYPDRLESYVSAKADPNAKAAQDFLPYVVEGNQTHSVPHSFGRPPLFHFSTGLPGDYGTAEHAPFMATQDILLKLTLGHMSAVDYTSIPQRYALLNEGRDSSDVEDQDDTRWWDTHDAIDPELRTHTREDKAAFKAQPGGLWISAAVKEFGQFDPADPAGFLSPAEFHLKIGAAASSTPLHLFDMTGDAPSGESLKVAMEPLIAKTSARRDVLDDAWVTFYVCVLAVLGFPNAQIDIRWAPVEPTSESETWSVARAKQDAGVPVDVTLHEGGYDEATVDAWQQEAAAGLPQRLAQLVQVGEFLASAATAVAGGAVTQDQVSAILTSIVGPLNTVDGVDSDDPAAA